MKFLSKIVVVLLLIVGTVAAQTPFSNISFLAGRTSGNAGGGQPGTNVALDIDLGSNKVQFINRFTYELADNFKRKPDSYYFTNKSVVRFGEVFALGAGVEWARSKGPFEDRNSFTPIAHAALRLKAGETISIVPYLEGRFGEFDNKLHKTGTFGLGYGAEAYFKVFSKAGIKVDVGDTYISFTKEGFVNRTNIHTPFIRGGFFVSF